MNVSAAMSTRQASVNAWLALAGAIVAQTGVQLIAPALPLMRDALGLTDSQLALVTSVYLLPAALGALPAGILADRIGRRKVFGWSLIAFGLFGVALQLAVNSFQLFLAIRFFQGLAFAGLMPLTMTILGDAFTGSALIRAQGHRTVAIHLGDGMLPIIGGFAVAIGWRAPWLGQLIAIPFGMLILAKMTDPDSLQGAGKVRIGVRSLLRLFRTRAIVALQFLGFLRMFLKFGIVTFIPLLLLDARGHSAAFAGLVIGAASLMAMLPALSAGWIARLARPTTLVALGVAVQGVALGVMALAPDAGLIFGASLVYGTADGLGGVYLNSFVSAATDAAQRGSFVAATGAIRNFAKFLAPAILGALVLVASLELTYTVIAVLTTLSALLAFSMRPLEQRLADQEAES